MSLIHPATVCDHLALRRFTLSASLMFIVVLSAAIFALLVPGINGVATAQTATQEQPATPAAGTKSDPGRQGIKGEATGKPASGGQGRRSRGPTTVILADVQTAVTNDRLTAIGNGDALASVSVVPLSNGVLTSVLVKSGQKISSGDVLATMDSEAEKIAVDRAGGAVADTRNNLERFESLRKSRSVTQVQLDQAKTDFENAKLARRDAVLKLERRSVIAPIAGIVGIVAVQTGGYVTTQTEIATIDDRSSLIVDFWVPERFASLINIGDTIEATAYAVPGEAFSGAVNAIGSRIERVSRTMQVRASIDNSDDTLRPGMSFSVKMGFAGNTFPAVEPLAVQWDSVGSFVWKVVEGKARRTAIRIIQRNPETVLVEGELATGEQVVVQGVLALRNGAEVQEAGATDR